jgi:hypothetical protein
MGPALQTDRFKGTKVLALTGVREYGEKYPVELWRMPNGRLVIVAENEAGNNETKVDLFDTVEWLQYGPVEGRTANGFAVDLTDGNDTQGDRERG